MINLGTDVINDWSFRNGDLQIVEGTGNLSQALTNRLNTYLDDLILFYGDYGSNLFDYMGEQNKPTIHEYIKVEVEDCIVKDNRVDTCSCTIDKVMNDEVYCNLSLILVDGTDMDLKMIITQENDVTIINGVE